MGHLVSLLVESLIVFSRLELRRIVDFEFTRQVRFFGVHQ